MPYFLLYILCAFVLLHALVGFIACLGAGEIKITTIMLVISIILGLIWYSQGSYKYIDKKGNNTVIIIDIDSKSYITDSFKLNDDILTFTDINGIKYDINISKINKYYISYYK